MPVNDEHIGILVVPREGDPRAMHKPGDAPIDCPLCEARCYISLESAEFLAKHPMEVMCLQCALEMTSQPDVEVTAVQWAAGDGEPLEGEDG